MKTTKTFGLPTEADSYEEMLNLIENSSTSFTEGRRNDDIVNWFLAKRLVEIDAGTSIRTQQAYVNDFMRMTGKLTKKQQDDLDLWEVHADQKIRILYDYYGKRNTVDGLHYLWLTQDYEVPGA